MKDLKVSIYQDSEYIEDKSIIEVFKDIKSGKYQKQVKLYRMTNICRHARDIKENGKWYFESMLASFTPCGTFGEGRSNEDLTSYSGIITLDFDDIPKTSIKGILDKINGCHYTMASFIKPTGEGIKVFIKVNSNYEEHSMAHFQLSVFYTHLIDCVPTYAADFARLCLVSSDPELYLNENASAFETKVMFTYKTDKQYNSFFG